MSISVPVCAVEISEFPDPTKIVRLKEVLGHDLEKYLESKPDAPQRLEGHEKSPGDFLRRLGLTHGEMGQIRRLLTPTDRTPAAIRLSQVRQETFALLGGGLLVGEEFLESEGESLREGKSLVETAMVLAKLFTDLGYLDLPLTSELPVGEQAVAVGGAKWLFGHFEQILLRDRAARQLYMDVADGLHLLLSLGSPLDQAMIAAVQRSFTVDQAEALLICAQMDRLPELGLKLADRGRTVLHGDDRDALNTSEQAAQNLYEGRGFTDRGTFLRMGGKILSDVGDFGVVRGKRELIFVDLENWRPVGADTARALFSKGLKGRIAINRRTKRAFGVWKDELFYIFVDLSNFSFISNPVDPENREAGGRARDIFDLSDGSVLGVELTSRKNTVFQAQEMINPEALRPIAPPAGSIANDHGFSLAGISEIFSRHNQAGVNAPQPERLPPPTFSSLPEFLLRGGLVTKSQNTGLSLGLFELGGIYYFFDLDSLKPVAEPTGPEVLDFSPYGRLILNPDGSRHLESKNE